CDESKVQKVLSSSDEEHQQPFKEKMDAFLKKAYEEHKEQEQNLEKNVKQSLMKQWFFLQLESKI
ncbi:hypothetical protein CEXT_298601, partial [Caerostris extrusa]